MENRTAWLGRRDLNHRISESDRLDAPDDDPTSRKSWARHANGRKRSARRPGLALMAIRQHMTIKGKAPTDRDKEGFDEDWADLQQPEGQGKSK